MRPRWAGQRAWALLVLVVLAACQTPRSPLPPPDLDAAALMANLETVVRTRRSLRAHTRIHIKAPDLRFRRPQRLALERPDRMRIEILAPFNQIAALLAVADGRYQLYESGSSEIEEGVVTNGLLWRVARVALTPAEAVDLLLGGRTPSPGLHVGPSRWHPEGRLVVDWLNAEDEPVERFAFDAEGRLRGFERLTPSGALVWSATFDEHRALTGGDGAVVSFAHELRLAFPLQEAKVEVRFEDVELDPTFVEGMFRIAIESGGDTAP